MVLASSCPSPVLAVTWLLEAGKLQPMHHTGLEQKLRGPKAQRSSHKGHGCHAKGRPHKTPAAKESTWLKLGEGLDAGPVCSHPTPPTTPISQAPRLSGHPGGGQAPEPPQHPLRTLHIARPYLCSCFALLLPSAQPILPILKGPHPSSQSPGSCPCYSHLPATGLMALEQRAGSCSCPTFQ